MANRSGTKNALVYCLGCATALGAVEVSRRIGESRAQVKLKPHKMDFSSRRPSAIGDKSPRKKGLSLHARAAIVAACFFVIDHIGLLITAATLGKAMAKHHSKREK